MELEQLDVKTAFLHGVLHETIYMQQPEGYEVKGKEDKVCLLKKSLYGLKQSPREWNQRFNDFMNKQQFQKSEYDPCVYIKGNAIQNMIYLLLYVDDMLIASTSKTEIAKLKKLLSNEFEMKDLGAARRILGMDIHRDRTKGVLTLSQAGYIDQILRMFNMDECKTVSMPLGSHFKLQSVNAENEITKTEGMDNVPYTSAVGSLMYAMVGSRPDLAYAIGMVSRYMSKPGKTHWLAVNWIMRYLKGAKAVNLTFKKDKDFRIRGYCDADYAADLDRRRSISGYVFTVGNNTISWRSRLQKVVALSTTESEYISLSEACREAVWIQGLCAEMKITEGPVEIYCDSQSAIYLAKNRMCSERTKHIQVKYNFIREVIEDGFVIVSKIHTSVNPADMFTKVIPGEKFRDCLKSLNMVEL